MEQQIINDLKDTRIKRQGLTLSGGDPLHPNNVEALLPFIQRVKQECPDKDIWVWTGYKLDELDEQQRAMLPYIDVLIDGKFIQEQADPSLIWRGSANQIIHRFKIYYYRYAIIASFYFDLKIYAESALFFLLPENILQVVALYKQSGVSHQYTQ